MAKNPLHSDASPEWYTPEPYVNAARSTLVTIDLDPATTAEANQTIKATTFYTQETDGLAQVWEGNVFLNPPGGLVPQFWNKLIAEFHCGNVKQAIWVGYSLQQLQTLQNVNEVTPLDFELCFPKKRIQFIKLGVLKSSPTHANYICYLRNKVRSVSTFRKYFSQFGRVI